MPEDRTAEIWSTRLQRELLALTSSESVPDEEGDAKNSRSDAAVLPPFVTVKEHSLDIVKATCTVTFQIEILAPNVETLKKGAGEEKEGKSEAKAENDAEEKTEGEKTDGTPSDESTSQNTEPSQIFVSFTLDASMKHNAKGDIVTSATTYPFQKPIASLTSGAEYFPDGSDVANGDEIEVSCDWTPSLHLSDAALNISLTVRECILRGEAYYKVKRTPSREENTIDALLRKFTLPSSSKSSKAKKAPVAKQKLRRESNEELQIGDIIDLNVPPHNMCAGMYSCKAIRRPQFMEAAIQAHLAAQNRANNTAEEDDENETPQGLGNYMKLQAGGIRKVAGSGILGTKSMFKTFLNSAKSAMEDSFLMITDSYIIELRSSKFNIGTATVTYATSVSLLAKLKFRRQESISLFFKQAPDDPLIFMCPDSADAVQQIQNVLKRHGVKGKHTNAATQRAIQSALNLVVEIQAREKELDDEPTVDNVDRIMSLYRQAAERFESAGDPRHEEVMNHMRKFLKKPRIMSILDGSYVDNSKSSKKAAPEGEILQATPAQLHHDSDDEGESSPPSTPKKYESDESELEHETAAMSEAMMNADRERADSFDMDDDLDNFLTQAETPDKKPSSSDDHDPVAELDAMFSAADKELADILNS